jgi:hypothetical protein
VTNFGDLKNKTSLFDHFLPPPPKGMCEFVIEYCFSRKKISRSDENSPQNKINKSLPQMGSGQVGIGDSSRSRNRRMYKIQDFLSYGIVDLHTYMVYKTVVSLVCVSYSYIVTEKGAGSGVALHCAARQPP